MFYQPASVHFADLTIAYEAVLKTRDQINRLSPIVADCDRRSEIAAASEQLRAFRTALRPYFGGLKCELLDQRIAEIDADLARLAERIDRPFALSLLVHERHYDEASRWVDETHLKGRFVYYNVPADAPSLRHRTRRFRHEPSLHLRAFRRANQHHRRRIGLDDKRNFGRRCKKIERQQGPEGYSFTAPVMADT